jgi:hypothetical protein
MTRASLRRTLRRVYLFIGALLAMALAAKLLKDVPVWGPIDPKDIYEFLRDMSLLIATGGVAYITNVFQKRHSFVEALREEWREIVETKSALLAYTHRPSPTHEQYVATFNQLSQTIDNMRTVYRNVGETSRLVGLYPFVPLHDMRRVLQTLDPRKGQPIGPDDCAVARDAMLQSFYALRDSFLDELDLEQPTRPILSYGARRMKRSGATSAARAQQEREQVALERHAPIDGDEARRINEMLTRQYVKEQSTAKPWRNVEGTDSPPSRKAEVKA